MASRRSTNSALQTAWQSPSRSRPRLGERRTSISRTRTATSSLSAADRHLADDVSAGRCSGDTQEEATMESPTPRHAAIFVGPMIVGLIAAQRAAPHVRTVDFLLI